MAYRRNAIRSYRPATESGMFYQGQRKIERLVENAKRITASAKEAKPRLQRMGNRLERMSADDVLRSQSSDRFIRKMGMASLSAAGINRMGQKAIRRRASRAAAVAARGKSAGVKAGKIYDQQLAYTGKGKPPKGKNNYRPGPSNTKGKPRKRRRRNG